MVLIDHWPALICSTIYIYIHTIMDEKGKYFWIRQNVEIQIIPIKARVAVHKRYKVISSGTQTYSARDNQTQVCMFPCHSSCIHQMFWIIILSGLLAQLGQHCNMYSRVVGSSSRRDWVYISNQKTLALQYEYHVYPVILHHI